MANEHVIDVKVRADTTELSKGLSKAEQDLGKAGEGFSKYGTDAEKASKQTRGFVDANRGHMESVGRDAAIMGGAVLAGIGFAVAAYSEFSGRMAQVQSLSHASAAEMDILTNSALSMGTAFGLSANDVADAEIELVKAGVSVKEMMGGALPGALALAAAGQIDVGKATEIATIALTQFNLKGKDVPHVADLLAAGADKALGGVSELGDGLKQGGLIASQFGLTIDDTVGTLAAFANAGLLGSDAGTSMKTMFLALASPSKAAQKALDEYNISAYDAKGNFKGVADLAGQLHDKLGPLSDAQRSAALSTIFGTDAMRSAAVLMKEGSTGIRKLISDVNDQGFAATQAAGKMDSLNGDFKKLQASFETGLIEMGAASDGFLRPVVQGLTDTIGAFNSLPEPVKGAGMAVAGVTGAGLLLGGALLTVIPKISDTVSAVQSLRDASPKTAGALGSIGKAAGVAAAGVVALQIAAATLTEKGGKSLDDYGQALLKVGKGDGAGLDSIFGKFDKVNGIDVSKVDNLSDAVKRLTNQTFDDSGNKFFQGFTDFIGLPKGEIGQLENRLRGLGDAMGNLVKTGGADLAAKGFKQLTTEFEKNGKGAKDALDYLPGYRDALKGMANDLKVPITEQDLLNLAVGQVPQKMKDAMNSTEGQAKMAEIAAKATEAQQKALDDLGIAADGAILHLDRLVASMIASGLITLSAKDAARAFEASLDALDEAIKTNGTTLDISTEKGRANEAAFDGIAGAGLRSAEAMARAGATQPEVQAQLEGTYNSLIKAAEKFGITGGEADTMARKVMGIPKDVPINTAIQNFADTMAKAQEIKRAIDGIQGKSVDVVINHINKQVAGGGYADDPSMTALTPGRAGGGAIDGSGPKGVDKDTYRLARGEHVWTAQEVDAVGGQSAMYQMRRAALDGGVRPMYGASAPAAVMGGAGTTNVSAPDVRVFIGNEQIDARIEVVAGSVTDAKLNNVATVAGGRR
ncbi:phage tail tape measure protein [Pseudarthrobacter sp. AL07]|uniref:phage tail tape measure protein n=1 Tax=unclassified Pseudarthrobacter TaxID=2647000 RepID=UPI00249B270F|nr:MULTISPECIES: phage tail tape measure protein [unclassified Pseudarthrobacter]MDI3194811.1 phage tail tape measure protein [Pseudarthrobacter sp. AL20]MDI3208941.1 phage tail tape measure protein [Pseudarthrobacter sp. AL07]